MRILVVGCLHGELERLYEIAREIEASNRQYIDLILCCGDFQAVRNPADMRSLNVPPKYAHLQSFYRYYNGECIAPILTVFVGGNHESSHFLQELPYGGWVAPNIYYMGYANVINIGGLRIAGISGIFNYSDYHKGHLEHPPYTSNTRVSAYHVRALEVLRLRQVRARVDIMLSHDWPRGVVECAGERATQQLLRFKPHFREDLARGVLGSPASSQLLAHLQPRFWFAAHLHCKFASRILHQDTQRVSNFLALDKCLPRRQFLQLLDIGPEAEPAAAALPAHLPLPLSTSSSSISVTVTGAPSSASESQSLAQPSASASENVGGSDTAAAARECTESTVLKAQPGAGTGTSDGAPISDAKQSESSAEAEVASLSPHAAGDGEAGNKSESAANVELAPADAGPTAEARGPERTQEQEAEADVEKVELVSSMVGAAAHSLRTGGLERAAAEQEEAAVAAAAAYAASRSAAPSHFMVGVEGDRLRPHVKIELDAEWLAILRKTDEYSRLRSRIDCIPSGGDLAPTEAEVAAVVADFGGDLSLPENWAPTAPIHMPFAQATGPSSAPTDATQARTLYLNPQTALLCAMLGITHAGAELAKVRVAGGTSQQMAKRGRVEHSPYTPHHELGDLQDMLVVHLGDRFEGETEQLTEDLVAAQNAAAAVSVTETKRKEDANSIVTATAAAAPSFNPDQISLDDD